MNLLGVVKRVVDAGVGRCMCSKGGWLELVTSCEFSDDLTLAIIAGGLVEGPFDLDDPKVLLRFLQHGRLLPLWTVGCSADGIAGLLTGSTEVRHRFHREDRRK